MQQTSSDDAYTSSLRASFNAAYSTYGLCLRTLGEELAAEAQRPTPLSAASLPLALNRFVDAISQVTGAMNRLRQVDPDVPAVAAPPQRSA